MPNQTIGLPVLVDVFAHPPGAPEPYTLDWKFQGGISQGNTPIDLPRDSGSHEMTFTLHDSSTKGLRFKATADEAMWVGSGNRCPNGKGNGKSQIMFKSVSQPDRLVLTVNDDNSGNRRNLRYKLRFDPDPNVWDPDIRNGGGGGKFDSTMVAATIGGGVAGAAITLLAFEATTNTNVAIGAAIGAVAGMILAFILGSMRGGGLQSSPPA